MRFVLSTVLMVLCFFSFAQTPEEIEICTALQTNQFYNETEANSALDRILDASGLAKNFTLTPCDNIKNAAAISYKGVRYILYDKEFLQTITDYTNDWANLFILAHEVGHHLNGHSVDVTMIDIIETKTLEAKRKQELEADEFAAFILAQLGAPLNDLIEPIDLVVSNEDDTFSTHPNKLKRKLAIQKGYGKYKPRIITKVVNAESKIEQESNLGEWKTEDFTSDPFRENDYAYSIKAINKIDEIETTNILQILSGNNVLAGSKYQFIMIKLGDNSDLMEILIARMKNFIADNEQLFRKRDGYSLDVIIKSVSLALAIDGEIMSDENLNNGINMFGWEQSIPFLDNRENYFSNFPSSKEENMTILVKTFNDEYLDYEYEIESRKMFNNLITKLKSGSKIYLKIGIKYFRKNIRNLSYSDYYLNQNGIVIDGTYYENLFRSSMYESIEPINIGQIDPVILQFSLNGSAKALETLKLLSLN